MDSRFPYEPYENSVSTCAPDTSQQTFVNLQPHRVSLPFRTPPPLRSCYFL